MRIANIILWILLGTFILGYIYSMFVFPYVESNGNWPYLQEVWHRWQSVNVGMLALASSAIAITAATLRSRAERKQNFAAARAFLPGSLSELWGYLQESSNYLCKRISNEDDIAAPNLPDDYKAVFADCIRYAEPRLGDFLCGILTDLQVHSSRMNSLSPTRLRGSQKQNAAEYLFYLAKITVKLDRMFPYARRKSNSFRSVPITFAEVCNSFAGLSVHAEDIDAPGGTLLEFAKRNTA